MSQTYAVTVACFCCFCRWGSATSQVHR